MISKTTKPPMPKNGKWAMTIAVIALILAIINTTWHMLFAMFPASAFEQALDQQAVMFLIMWFLLLWITPAFFGFWLKIVILFLMSRRYGWSRWLFAGSIGLGFIFFMRGISEYGLVMSSELIMSLLIFGLNVVATALLFTKPVNDWFKKSSI